jgi:hypothetical protein
VDDEAVEHNRFDDGCRNQSGKESDASSNTSTNAVVNFNQVMSVILF